MGWLGWSEQTTLDTTIPAILLALEGRQEMLSAIFGGGSKDGETEATEPLASPDVMRSVIRMMAG